MKKAALFLFASLVLASLLAGIYLYQYLFLPLQTPGTEKTVIIAPGDSLHSISESLQQEDIIQNARSFRLLARLSNKAQSIQAGEFALDTSWSRVRILKHLCQGQVVLHKINIPEGLTWWQIAQLMHDSGLSDFKAFAQAVQDKNILESFDIPAKNLEGYLYPETYQLPKPLLGQAQPIVGQMVSQFYKVARNSLWPEGLPEASKVHRTVILASLVEKETGRSEERRRIAGVLQNRLERNMPLQCDPTVIYGLGPEFDSRLRKKELNDQDNPYNTYQHPGLPPGPICSPGLESLKAALNPEEHSYLYFVSKGDGSHKFSKNLKEHNQAVRKYILGN
ncbi:MAG: endolytic transglycosylase MltG [Desulfohalobiaceae bacterium]